MINMHDIKRGAAVMVDGQPYFVIDFHRAGTGQRRPVLHVKLKHIVSGSLTEKTLSEKDVLEEPDVEKATVTYSYRNPHSLVFMDAKTYAEIEIAADIVGDKADLLGDEVEVRVLLLDGIPVGLEFPPSVTLEVTETAEPQKGAPASRTSSVGKPATLSNGAQVDVPMFIRKGERIRIDTETRQYLGKDKE
jgi:elongation factor P